MSHYLGIDIGGTAIKYAIGYPGKESVLSSLISTPKTSLPDFLAATRALISSLIRDYPIQGIGIATPGTIDRQSGKLKGVNPNLPWWTDVSPLLIVPDEYRHIAFCDNDANLMTLAEAKGSPAFVLGVTIGTGIGSGFVMNNAVY
ncbi:MAG TPA: ROK family protein, partial [Candidatus Cloacimonadota bacterium]|nr:ROK family protein [Candidatus Cloacimonadota bacterium]